MGGRLSTTDIRTNLRSTFGIDIELSGLEGNLAALRKLRKVVAESDGTWSLARDAAEEIEGQVADAESTIKAAAVRFEEITRKRDPNLNPSDVWNAFCEDFLVPLIKRMGARTYELVSGRVSLQRYGVDFHEFLTRFPDQQRTTVREIAMAFLDPRDSVCRSYVLGQLNGWFVLQAASFDANTVRKLEDSQSSRPSFVVFVDTNFLFSILGLHENPSNEAAQQLMWIGGRLKNRVDLRFYVAAVTIEEAQMVLDKVVEDARGMVLGRNLAAAAEEAGDIGGILLKYLEECKKADRPLDVDDYFGPYQRNLVTAVRGKHVDLFSQTMDEYRTRHDVLEDLNGQLVFERTLPPRRRKTYAAWLHDMMLWHLVKDMRPAAADSFLDACYWIVTIDFRLLGFDTFKHNVRNLPICAHPSSLIQALQLWVPRSEELDAALMDTFRLPLLMGTFDAAAERVTINILKTLSRYEGVDDLSEETIAAILMNEALRHKLASEPNVETQVKLVREAVIEELARTKGELGQAQVELGQAQVQVERLQREVADRGMSETALRDRVTMLESQTRQREEKERIAGHRSRFVLLCVLLPFLILGTLASAAGIVVDSGSHAALWQSMLVAWSLALMMWLSVARFLGNRMTEVVSWVPFRVLAKTHAFLFGVLLLTVLTSVLGNAAYELIRSTHWR